MPMSEPHYVAQAPPPQAGRTLAAPFTKQAALCTHERERDCTHARSCPHGKPASTNRVGAVAGRPPSTASSRQHSGKPMQGGCCARGTGYRDLAQWRRDQRLGQCRPCPPPFDTRSREQPQRHSVVLLRRQLYVDYRDVVDSHLLDGIHALRTGSTHSRGAVQASAVLVRHTRHHQEIEQHEKELSETAHDESRSVNKAAGTCGVKTANIYERNH